MSESMMKKIQAARALVNPLKGLGPYMEILLEASSFVLDVQYQKSPLPGDILTGCMDLFVTNMADLYEASAWGLDLDEKKAELDHEHARFLLVMHEDDLVGFLHFRFDVNDDDEPTEEVLYVYELQIAPKFKSRGIGRRLMAIMEVVAMRTEMKKVMLTVFKSNTVAFQFYTSRMNYSIDSISPSQHGVEADYEILSKQDLMKAA